MCWYEREVEVGLFVLSRNTYTGDWLNGEIKGSKICDRQEIRCGCPILKGYGGFRVVACECRALEIVHQGSELPVSGSQQWWL